MYNSKPYAIFGSKPYVSGADSEHLNVFVIENLSEGSKVARLEHNTETGLVTYFDKEGNPLGQKQLKKGERAWGVIDPKAEKRYNISPYAYCSNNPINRIDPDGQLDDWVKNWSTMEYEWMDNVTSKTNTPIGYEYVGAKNSDIIKNLNISTNQETQSTWKFVHYYVDEANGVHVSALGAPDAKTSISISANVTNEKGNISENNTSGRTFKGVDVTARTTTSGTPPGVDVSTSGRLTVSVGIQKYNANLAEKTYSGGTISAVGSSTKEASVMIPASGINSFSAPRSIEVSGRWVQSVPGAGQSVLSAFAIFPRSFTQRWGF